MRLSDQDFSKLKTLDEFNQYYDNLSVDEVMSEIDRIYTEGPVHRALFQQLAMHRRLTDGACFDTDLLEHQRNSVIGVVTGMRETIERVLLRSVDSEMRQRVLAALASTDDYVERFGNYPRAALMIRVGARKPIGPYELGVIGEVLTKS